MACCRLIQDTGAMYKESNIWRRDASYLRLKTLELGIHYQTVF